METLSKLRAPGIEKMDEFDSLAATFEKFLEEADLEDELLDGLQSIYPIIKYTLYPNRALNIF